jgi:hypothetical protein
MLGFLSCSSARVTRPSGYPKLTSVAHRTGSTLFRTTGAAETAGAAADDEEAELEAGAGVVEAAEREAAAGADADEDEEAEEVVTDEADEAEAAGVALWSLTARGWTLESSRAAAGEAVVKVEAVEEEAVAADVEAAGFFAPGGKKLGSFHGFTRGAEAVEAVDVDEEVWGLLGEALLPVRELPLPVCQDDAPYFSTCCLIALSRAAGAGPFISCTFFLPWKKTMKGMAEAPLVRAASWPLSTLHFKKVAFLPWVAQQRSKTGPMALQGPHQSA